MSLEIKNLQVQVDNKTILHGIHLTLQPGRIEVIMGPNGSGKSTLANTLMGHPKYKITQGSVMVDEVDITSFPPDKRAKAGLFLSPQYSPEISGVTIGNFLRLAKKALTGNASNPLNFQQELIEKMKLLHLDTEMYTRYLNTGFSGGEKKKLEILQLAVLNPRYAILDETDSGLDVDALKIVAEGINRFKNADTGVLLITHYNRILEYVRPDVIHIMKGGTIVRSGDKSLAKEIEETGYSNL